MRYTISEMAALLGVTTHTLRYYEKMGLIQPEVNRETGYRYYTVTDTRRFNLCRELRAAGFTLEECKDFLDEPSTAVTDAMLDRQIRQLERRQVLNRMSIRFLQKTREYYHTLEQDAGRCGCRTSRKCGGWCSRRRKKPAMTPPCRPKRPSGWSACRRCTGSAACPAG